MKNLMTYKMFDAYQIGTTLTTSREDLTTYYKCNKCDALFKMFNDTPEACPKCNNIDIKTISDFEYMTELKDKRNSEEYSNEMRDKKKREGQIIDLVKNGVSKEIANRKKYIN